MDNSMWIPAELNTVIELFPNQKAKVIQLYVHDSIFKSLCEDLMMSMHTLNDCRSDADQLREMELEYKSICSLLLTELEHYLKKN